MTIQRMPGSAITPGTITVVQLESTVATTVSTGGGPKITNLAITSNVNATLDDTAVDLTGGFIRLTGTGFNTGCLVYAGLLPAASTTFISNTEVRAQLSAQSAGTYPVYLVNTDGGTAIRVPGVTYSASPAWQTASSLGDQYDGVLLNLSVVATDAVSYSVVSGSLPPGLSLNSNTGVISGTITGVVNDTVYTFTINAVDAQLQDSPRVFTINVTVSDPYFKLTTLLLTGNSGNTVVTDSSVNNFAITVVGDSRASNFSPYLTGWSNYFDGTGDYLSIADNDAFTMGSGSFTLEAWVYVTATTGSQMIFGTCDSAGNQSSMSFVLYARNSNGYPGIAVGYAGSMYHAISDELLTHNQWNHIAGVRNGASVMVYVNGVQKGNIVNMAALAITDSSQILAVGRNGAGNFEYLTGYISNARIVKGTAVYTANFTPATTTLTSVANTSLLTCHANRLVDSSTNNFAITKNGDVRVESFNPFNLTNTGTTGSMYFDGTGDCLSIPTSAISTVGSNNFSMECWVYPLRQTNTYSQGLISYGVSGSSAGTSYISFELSSSGYAAVAFAQGSSLTITSSTITPINQWSHIALCRSGSTLSIFLNGNRVATTSTSATIGSSGNVLFVGSSWYANEAARNLQGYISNARILNGASAYDATQSTITVPTTPLTAIANTSLLTLQSRQPPNNHTFQDLSSNNFLITRSGNATQGSFSPFSQSGWSVYFDGSDDRLLSTSSSGLGLQSNNFCIELWVYLPIAPTSDAPFVVNLSGSGFIANTFWFGPHSVNSGRVTVYIYNFSSSSPFISESSAVPTQQWVHYALTRNGNTFSIYRNGVLTASGSFSGAVNSTSSVVYIGRSGDGPAPNTLTGYISNLRIVNGNPVYTGAFTPPTSILGQTQSSGTNINAITGGQTSFLACQSNRFVDITGNTTISVNAGNPSVQAFSPFAPTATYSAVTHGGSAYFDGSGDYLTLSTNPLLNVGTSNFSVEFWGYFTTASATNRCIFSSSTNGLALVRSTFFFVSQYGVADYASSSTLPLNSWLHIVVTRSGTALRVFINGKLEAYNASVSNNFSNTNNVQICADGTNGQLNDGYIANFRLIKGSIPTEYQTSSTTTGTQIFTPPTAPVTTTNDTSLLLNFTNDAIEDATGRNVIETVGDARTTSAVTKWAGSHSMSFDGTGDYLATSTGTLLNLSGDFTIEGWVYLNSSSTNVGFFSNGDFSATAQVATDVGSGAPSLFISNGSGWAVNLTSTQPISTLTWTHVAYVCYGSTFKIFVNGVQGASTTYSGTRTTPSSTSVVGRLYVSSNNYYLNGYIQDLRITRGYARYTANFTPPTISARLK